MRIAGLTRVLGLRPLLFSGSISVRTIPIRHQSQWPTPQERFASAKKIFNGVPAIVKIIVGINTLIFGVYTFYGPLNPPLRHFVHRHFVLSRPNIIRGYYDSLVGAMFMHGSILHLGFNMYSLWQFAKPASHFLLPRQFLGLYLATGIAGNFAQVSDHEYNMHGKSGRVL
jgi:membrane associated rhomboid family serine protease